MASFSFIPLSGSTNGRPIGVVATASPGTTIHSVSTATGVREFPYVWGANHASTARKITLEWGSTASTSQFTYTLQPEDGLTALAPGCMLVGATGQDIRAYGTATDGLKVLGYVDRAS